MSATLPLLESPDTDATFAWWRGGRVSRAEFLTHARRVAAVLARPRFALNLCEDRYLFLVAFAAVLISSKTNLLPPSRASQDQRDIVAAYSDSQILGDSVVAAALAARPATDPRATPESALAEGIPRIETDHVAVVAFTSGSTGQPRAHPKRWGDLVTGAHCADRRFGFRRTGATVVATVPAQHMYGLETSVLVPLACGVAIYGGRPFYAEDIRAALASIPAPRALITTPIHLRVCVESALSWPAIEFIISATAPLSSMLASAAEHAFGAPVLEIYGCTEAGSIASRRRLDGDVWKTYDGMSIRVAPHGCLVQGVHLPEAVPLSDVLTWRDATHFELAGRTADMVNIAGKRASLGDLTLKLNDIDGVHDAAFVAPEEGDAAGRLLALVVAPELSESDILRALARRIDPAFLPRPLYKVDRLPRDALGKLPRAELLALVQRLRMRA